MDIEIMQRQLRDLMKFRDDFVSIATREGTLDAFNALVAERRAQIEEDKAHAAAAEQAELDAEKEAAKEPVKEPDPAKEPVKEPETDGESGSGAKEPIPGAEKAAGEGSGDGA